MLVGCLLTAGLLGVVLHPREELEFLPDRDRPVRGLKGLLRSVASWSRTSSCLAGLTSTSTIGMRRYDFAVIREQRERSRTRLPMPSLLTDRRIDAAAEAVSCQ